MKQPMKLGTKLALFLLLATAPAALGQPGDYTYRRQITGITGLWHRVQLPDDLFGKVSPELEDIRMYGVTAAADTIEVPYLLQVAEDRISEEDIPFRTINGVYNSQGYYVTLEVPAKEPVNRIRLQLDQLNFNWNIRLEGSQDQSTWFTVLDDYRIVSVKNEWTDYQFTELIFPDAVYRYYRLFIPEKEKKPVLRKASLKSREQEAGIARSYASAFRVSPKNRETKQTVISVQLSQPVPLSRLQVHISDRFDYYRPVTIDYLTDSVKTEKGWHYQYRTLTKGTLSSLEKNTFRFKSTITSRLRITIDDRDNEPLHIGDIRVQGPEHTLIARFTEPADYFLVYGNRKAGLPNYDLAQFSDKVPADAPSLHLQAEEQLRPSPSADNPLFSNSAWLWAIIVVMVLLIGVFTVRMMRNT